MFPFIKHLPLSIFIVFLAGTLQAAAPDISNLNNCIQDVRQAENSPPEVLTFDSYTTQYQKLLADLETAASSLPHVYQEVAAKPLIDFLKELGEGKYLDIFNDTPTDYETALLYDIIPDAAIAILSYQEVVQGINAFQEVVSDLYDTFVTESKRTTKETNQPIKPLNYGIIPPLVKFGNGDYGPYTWPGDATYHVLGMGCGIVSLPPAQLAGGLIAWTALGHETAGHDVMHADVGLLQELAQKIYAAVLKKFNSRELATYWANCTDETVSDVCGYLNMGPSAGIGLVGYFRALGNGRLRNIGYKEGPHPIDLLRGYLAAAVAERLHFSGGKAWSQTIEGETKKDNKELYLVDSYGKISRFPVSLDMAIESTEVVAQTILRAKLQTLENHSLQGIQDWLDKDQAIVNNLVSALKNKGKLPSQYEGPYLFASHVIAAATEAALQQNGDVAALFIEMQNFLATMHQGNPVWSQEPTEESIAILQHEWENKEAPELPVNQLALQ